MTPCFSIVCFFISSNWFLEPHTPFPVSGHGGQTKDTNGDEADGFDEGF